MAIVLPLDASGNREIMISTPDWTYLFRTYYSDGPEPGWFMDIRDVQRNPLRLGLRIVTGAANSLKGLGETLKNDQMVPVTLSGGYAGTNALGNTAQVVWYGQGETNPYPLGDPMIDIPIGDWIASPKPVFEPGYFLGLGKDNRVFVRNEINVSNDGYFSLRPNNVITLADNPSGTESNQYVAVIVGNQVILKNVITE